MTTMEHCVAPEDVMALLDGELPAVEAQAVSAHLERCAQCAMLAEDFRGTMRTLSGWSVPAVPVALEDSVMAAAAKAAAGRSIAGSKPSFRNRFWNWKLLVSGSAAVMALLALVVFLPTTRNPSAPQTLAPMLTSVNGALQSRGLKISRVWGSRSMPGRRSLSPVLLECRVEGFTRLCLLLPVPPLLPILLLR